MKKILGILLTFVLMGSENSNARTIKVNSIPELQSAINSAKKGDVIELADNTYANAGLINIKTSGITVMAATVGGVIITGGSQCIISGDNNTLSGFQFKNGDIGSGKVVEMSGNYNILTQCNFYNYVSKNYIHIEGGSHHNEISYCNIEAKPATHNAGPGIQITTSESVVNHTWIHHCTFLNFGGEGGDFGNEPIRIGLGVEQNNTSGAVIEFCYFENLGLGDSESISVKSTFNVIRFNTFNENPLAQLVFRTGNKNTAYGNFFINSGGIRIKEGGNHMVYNNYFQGATEKSSIELMNFKLNKKTNVGSPLSNIYLYHNTFYNAGKIDLGGSGANPPTSVQFANNIFYKQSGTILENINNNVTYLNNMYFGGAALGVAASKTEFINADPLLVLNKNEYYSLSPKSPAINASNGAYPAILDNPEVDDDPNLLLDIERQPRPADKTQKDIGCDEYVTGEVSNHPLKKGEAGPSYLSNVKSEVPVVKPTVANITDSSSFENEYFKVSKNAAASHADELGTRVIVALSDMRIKSSTGVSKLVRGDVEVLKAGEKYSLRKGEYFEVIVKKNHPALKLPGKWIEPLKIKMLYDGEQFRVFEEGLEPGDTRELHSHAQRMVVRLNEVELTDPRFAENTLPGKGLQIPNTVRFAEATMHTVKNLSKIPLLNIIIEFKVSH